MTITTLAETPTEVPRTTPAKAKRVRTGCLTCRERHLKCDEAVPDCVNCRKSNRTCKRGVRLNFLEVSVCTPVFVCSSVEWAVQFQDESRDIASEYKGGLSRYAPYDTESTTPQQTEFAAITWLDTPHQQLGERDNVDIEAQLELNGTNNTNLSATPSFLTRLSPYLTNFSPCQTDIFGMSHRDLFSQSSSTTPLNTVSIHSRCDEPLFGASLQEQELMAIKEQAAYQARRKSDTSSATSIVPLATNATQSFVHPVDGKLSPDEPMPVPPNDEVKNGEREYLSSPDEIYYMQVFVDKVGTWMDSFDKDKHFSRIIPYHALKSTMLLNAFLACGLKHSSLFSPETEDKALFYYNTATTQLLRNLQNPDRNPVECATAAVVLNVYEIMSEKPAQRMNHIAGARALIRECGWDASSTGIGSACFWLNIGMEVLHCLSMDWQTTWDPGEWDLDINFSADDDGDAGIGQEEVWVHRMFYIIAKTVNFRALAPSFTNLTTNTLDHLRLSNRVTEWQDLKQLCDRWNNACPRTMHPLGYLRKSESRAKSAFPQIWMIKRAAIIGRLFYHTAQCILAQTHPLESNKASPEMRDMELHHAHQICGIVAHSEGRGVASVAVRCLPIAAAVLVVPREQEEVLVILGRLASESGCRLGMVEKELKRTWALNHNEFSTSLFRSLTADAQEVLVSQAMGHPLPPPAMSSSPCTPLALAPCTARISTPPVIAPVPMREPLNPLNYADFALPNHPYQNWYEPPNRADSSSQRLL